MPMKARFSCTLTDQNRGDEGVQGYPSVQEDAHNKLMLLLGMLQMNTFLSRQFIKEE